MHCGRMDDEVEKGDDVAEEERVVERNRGGIIMCNVRYHIDKQARRKVEEGEEQEEEAANEESGIVVLSESSKLELEKII
jgi:hypothetical protein